MIRSAKSLDWTGWTKTEKPFDRDRPFHRINSPTMKEEELRRPDDTDETLRQRQDKLRVSGDGRGRGCKIPDDIPFASATEITLSAKKDPRNLVRTVPGWVLVEANNEQLQEIEGVLVRSYQTWTDVPLFQWHRWYDWNFMVVPAPGYGYLRGRANRPPQIEEDDRKKGFTRAVVRDLDGTDVETMEVEFDCGLFGSRFCKPSIIMPQSFGPMFEGDLAWPTVGSHFWSLGRWIYDCSHPDKKDGLTRSELHPCRALASARWEAFQFKENGDAFVPAIQFMFFASRLGGYTDEETTPIMPRQDFEFIVDLPEFGPVPVETYPIGHTPEIPHNTIQIRPTLLVDFNFQAFEDAIARTPIQKRKNSKEQNKPPKSTRVKPKIKPIIPKSGPRVPPRQVLVTIPMASVPVLDDFYGVIISLGWRDIDQQQPKKVRHFKVTFQQIDVGIDDHEEFLKGKGEWQVRMGVNGRWAQKREEGIAKNSSISLGGKKFEFNVSLAEDDFLVISCHGEETDNVHDTYKNHSDDSRTLFLPALVIPVPIPFTPNINIGGRPVLYFQDCEFGDPPPRKTHNAKLARQIVSAMEDDQFTTLGQENNPLGRIDPFHRISTPDRLGRVSSENPIPVSKLTEKATFVQVGVQSQEVQPLAELAENPSVADYTIVYTVEEIPPPKKEAPPPT